MQIRLVYDHASSAPQRLDFRVSYDDSQNSQIDFLHFPHCADVDPHLAVLLKRDNWYVAVLSICVSQRLCLIVFFFAVCVPQHTFFAVSF